MCHSATAFATGMQFDFQGIIILMWGANIPLIYYSFECHPKLRIVYWALTSFLAACCSVVTCQPQFSQPLLRPMRAATFGSLALSTFIPVIHGFIKYGKVQFYRIAFPWVIVTLGLNIAGAGAYAAKVRSIVIVEVKANKDTKFPEKWFRRRFDIFGASHQIMHIMVLLAGLAFAMGVLQQFDYLHEHSNQCKE